MMTNIGSQFETDETLENYEDLYDEQVEYLNNKRSSGLAPPLLRLKQQRQNPFLSMRNFV